MTSELRKALSLGGLFLVIGLFAARAYAAISITGIDATGMVTAKDTASGRVFQFKVTDRALLRSLHIDQAISADFSTNKVAVNGAKSCCDIVAGATPGGAAAKLGVHDSEVDGVSVALLEVKRDNPMQIGVRWRYENTTAEARTIGRTTGSLDEYSLDRDSYVVDQAGRLKYEVLRDTNGNLLAARHSGSGGTVTLRPHQTLSIWAKFAVPADVAKVDVYLSGAEPFQNVAVAH